MSNTHNERSVTDKNLEKGGKDFEVFWLRPKKMTNKEAILRLHISSNIAKRWGGILFPNDMVFVDHHSLLSDSQLHYP